MSLRELDPIALLRLRDAGTCEFALSEALYDEDFPGHYRRQIRTVTVTFLDADGQIRAQDTDPQNPERPAPAWTVFQTELAVLNVDPQGKPWFSDRNVMHLISSADTLRLAANAQAELLSACEDQLRVLNESGILPDLFIESYKAMLDKRDPANRKAFAIELKKLLNNPRNKVCDHLRLPLEGALDRFSNVPTQVL